MTNYEPHPIDCKLVNRCVCDGNEMALLPSKLLVKEVIPCFIVPNNIPNLYDFDVIVLQNGKNNIHYINLGSDKIFMIHYNSRNYDLCINDVQCVYNESPELYEEIIKMSTEFRDSPYYNEYLKMVEY